MLHPRTREILALFTSKNEAAKALGVNRKHIQRACGEENALCCGYLWNEVCDSSASVNEATQILHLSRARDMLKKRKRYVWEKEKYYI